MGKDQEFLEAARNGNFSVVEKVLASKAKRSGPLASLRRGPGPNIQDASGYSALHHAALNGHKDIVQLLLMNEASANIVDVKGSSPLHLAAWSGNIDIVRMLLCQGPSIPHVNLVTKDNETALHCAAQYGHTNVVCLLLEHSCDPSIKNTKQETALDLAAQYGRLEVVDMLVRTHPELIQPYNGTSSNTIFPHTPLHLASRNGHKFVVDVLLSAGMNVNLKTNSGTALHEAAMCGKSEVVRTLLEHGIDLSLKDAQNNTVLDVLKQFPCHAVHDIYSVIRKYRPTYSERDDFYQTASLGSPYDNASYVLDSTSPCSVSPMHYESYDRRLSNSCSMSTTSDIVHNRYSNYHQQLSTSYADGTYYRDDWQHKDFDSASICSTTSSNCSRDRRSPYGSQAGISQPLPSPGSVGRKISPTPPKKPPRRNLSISPTQMSPHLITMASDQNGFETYEYVFVRGDRLDNNLNEIQMYNGSKKPRDGVGGSNLLRRGKSAEHYSSGEAARLRHSVAIDHEGPTGGGGALARGKSEDLHLLDAKYQPIAITSVRGNVPHRTTNPRRKLRRHAAECEAMLSRGDLPFRKVEERAPIVVERIMSASVDRERRKSCPRSPTHYRQPPTPDHPPPPPVAAERHIHERIRPLSQEYSNLKRKSRDIETETEEELLLLVFPGSYDALSDGSISSSVSLSDKSVSTDHAVEEYIGDAPFAGLFKGSLTPDSDSYLNITKRERPKTLRDLKTVHPDEYGQGEIDASKNDYSVDTVTNTTGAAANDKNVSMSILSPFDEQEEWTKISEIMASFGNGNSQDSGFVTELEKEFQSRLGLNRMSNKFLSEEKITLTRWLNSMELAEFESAFINFGYDDINFIKGVINDCDLKELGIMNESDREKVLQRCDELTNNVGTFWTTLKKDADRSKDVVVDWLESLNLSCYLETFRKNLYTELDRIKKIWEVELTAVLEINKPGHRRRILASVNACKVLQNQNESMPVAANLKDLHADLDQLKNNIQEMEEEIRMKSGPVKATEGSSTLRHRKKSRPAPQPPNREPDELEIRNPSELLIGVPATLKTQWRHKPRTLVTGTIDYIASYLGSTVVKELRGTESTKKSIQKLKKSTSVVDCRVTPEIILAISYRGVKFLDVSNQGLICEHEIRNIHCACQDSEDLTHFAYITKDRASKTHYCHVFCVQTMDQATEVILTLGEAFEVAYQMALKESESRRPASPPQSHSRSYSVDIVDGSIAGLKLAHGRSHSVSDIKILNGTLSKGLSLASPTKAPIAVSEDI